MTKDSLRDRVTPVSCVRDRSHQFDWVRGVHLFLAVYLPVLAGLTHVAEGVGMLLIPSLMTFVVLHAPPSRKLQGTPLWTRLRKRFLTTTFLADEHESDQAIALVRGVVADPVTSRMHFLARNTALVQLASGLTVEVYGGNVESTPIVRVPVYRRAPGLVTLMLTSIAYLVLAAVLHGLPSFQAAVFPLFAAAGALPLVLPFLRRLPKLVLGADGIRIDAKFIAYAHKPMATVTSTGLTIDGIQIPLSPQWAMAAQSAIELRTARATRPPSELVVARFRASNGGTAFREADGLTPQEIVQIAHSPAVEPRVRVAAVEYLQTREPALAAKIRVAESLLDPAVEVVLAQEKGETRKSRL